ncbi:MAG TPA: hypothetical protein VGL83_13820 [Stellaceae bacterium]|jgi:hypothetical protein
MLNEIETDDRRARVAEVEARRVALGDIARWFAPWILAGILIMVFIGGLWCASSADDVGTDTVGYIAAVLALAALIWQLGVALSGRPIIAAGDRWLVEDETSIVVLIALLVVMAVIGLVLAARADSVAASGAGYGLCLFGIVFIFANLKHYFDRREG